MAKKRLKLGNKAKDVASGMVGVLTSRHVLFDGTVQFGLTPASASERESSEAKIIDEAQLVYVEDAIESTPPTSTTVMMGGLYRDELTGFTGTAGERVEFINGCVYYVLFPKPTLIQRFFGSTTDPKMFSAGRLVSVKKLSESYRESMTKPKEQNKPKAPTVETKEDTETKSVGGPTRSFGQY